MEYTSVQKKTPVAKKCHPLQKNDTPRIKKSSVFLFE